MEAEHLGGDTDMVALIAALLSKKRAAGRREDFAEIPMRPDHGHEILDDVGRASFPGYPFMGDCVGWPNCAVITALSHAGTRHG